MEWIVKIEGEQLEDVTNRKLPLSNQRVKVIFIPMDEKIYICGEFKPHNKEWQIFSQEICSMIIDLDELTLAMERAIKLMKKRIEVFENFDKGFSVLKLIAFEEE